MVDSGQSFGDGGGVGNHTDGSLDSGEIATRNDGGRLVVDTALETGGTPVDELDGSLGLDGGDSSVHILGDDVTSEHETAGHVLAVSGIALGHHVGRFEDRVGDLRDGELLVVSLLGRDDGSVRGEHEVNSRIRHQVGLELVQIDVQGTLESERGGEGRDNLSDESVQVGVSGSLDVEVSSAHVVQGFVVHGEGTVGVFEEGVCGKYGVVRLNDGGSDLGSGGDGEGKLGLSAVVNGESLQEEGTETGSGTTTSGVEDHETLETSTVVGELSHSVEDQVDDFLADGVVTSGVVVGSVFLAGDDLLGVVELSVGAGSDLVTDGGFEIDVDGSGHVLASSSFGEEGVEGIVTSADGLVGRHLTVGLDAVLEAVKLPAGVTGLDTGLTKMD